MSLGKNMLGIYFIGTGNTKFCVNKFLELYNENNIFESYPIEDKICVSKIKNGLTLFNHIAGLFGQRLWFYNKTKKLKNKLILDYDKCISCKMCMVECPVNNFIEENGKPKAQGKCTCCYRCISNCPKQAITLIGKIVYEQSKIEKYLG